MKKTLILAPLALCALPALAQSQSVSLFYSQLTSRDTSIGTAKVTTDKSKGLGLRYGHDIATFSRLGDARLAFEGTWMPRTSGEDIEANGTPLGGVNVKFMYRHQYLGLGLSMAWTKIVDFGAALELRHEGNTTRIETDKMTLESGCDITRPWISLRGGYTFAIGSLKPFVGVEYNLPLAKKQNDIDASMGELGLLMGGAQNLNPKSQISLNAGVRF